MARSFAPVSLAAPTFGEEEVQAVREVLASGWVAGQGPRGAQLEERWAARAIGRVEAKGDQVDLFVEPRQQPGPDSDASASAC